MYDSNQPLIRFPTITKLLYTGNPHQIQYQPRKTSLSVNKFMNTNAYKTNTVFSTFIKQKNKLNDKNFNVVQLPQGSDVMGISSMNMIRRETKSTSINNGPLLSTSLQKNKQDSSEYPTRFNSLMKYKSQSNKSLMGVSFSVKRKYMKSQTNYGHHTIEKKIDFSQLYPQILSLLALSHGVYIKKDTNRVRRAKVEPGNNGFLVRQTVKKRGWWNTTTQSYQSNSISLIWTEHIRDKKKQKEKEQNQEIPSKDQRQNIDKVIFQRNFAQCLRYYPKILQLFFINSQQIPKRLSEWVCSMPNPQRQIIQQNLSISNHLLNNQQITNKKMLFQNLTNFFRNKQMDLDLFLPKTYHLTAFNWQQSIKIIRENQLGSNKKKQSTRAWFIKPGQNTNRGKGITVYKTLEEALDCIIKHPPKDQKKTIILQKYILPVLYEGRKFDIRCFMLGIRIYDYITFYWYEQGYVRTASEKFTLKNTSRKIHLTNDAVQKNINSYGQYEQGNKLSYSEIQKYLKNAENIDYSDNVIPQMKKIAGFIAEANASKLGSSNEVSFELFGLDFILGQKGQPYLLQVNTNPSLEICCNLTSRIISQVVENTLRIVLDMMFPCPKGSPQWAQNFILQNKFALIYRLKNGDCKQSNNDQKNI